MTRHRGASAVHCHLPGPDILLASHETAVGHHRWQLSALTQAIPQVNGIFAVILLQVFLGTAFQGHLKEVVDHRSERWDPIWSPDGPCRSFMTHLQRIALPMAKGLLLPYSRSISRSKFSKKRKGEKRFQPNLEQFLTFLTLPAF